MTYNGPTSEVKMAAFNHMAKIKKVFLNTEEHPEAEVYAIYLGR